MPESGALIAPSSALPADILRTEGRTHSRRAAVSAGPWRSSCRLFVIGRNPPCCRIGANYAFGGYYVKPAGARARGFRAAAAIA